MRCFVLTLCFLINSMVMAASDSCKVTVNVKTPPVTFGLAADGTKIAPSIDVAPGQGFQIVVSYQDGKAPYTCALANAPVWMSAANDDASRSCVVSGTVPIGTADGAVTGDLSVTDANGTTAKLALGPPKAAPGL